MGGLCEWRSHRRRRHVWLQKLRYKTVQYVLFYLRLYLGCTYCLRSLKVNEKYLRFACCFLFYTFYLLFDLLLLFTYVLLNLYLPFTHSCVLLRTFYFLFTCYLLFTYCSLRFTYFLLHLLLTYSF